MKVRELIALLKKHGQNAEVSVYNDDTDEGRPSMELINIYTDSYDGNQDVFLVVRKE
jgi:hypothetical protein